MQPVAGSLPAVVRYEDGVWRPLDGEIVTEALVRLHVNGQELAGLMCSPVELDLLALGFLRSEGIIGGLADVRLLKVCPSAACVDVWLRRADFVPPSRWIITSVCGGGVTFGDLASAAGPLVSDVRVTVGQLGRLMSALLAARRTRGGHAAGLAEGSTLLAVAEDVGRHNAIDKLWGRCLVEKIATRDRILLSTGRISSEMLSKAARMAAPVVASHTSPTTLSVALANAWGVTLAGYVRRGSLSLYAGRERVSDTEEAMDAHS